MGLVTVTVEWPATIRCVDTTAVILIAGQIYQKQRKSTSRNGVNRPLSRRLDRCDRVIQDESGDSNGGNV